jgi:hypothetical protein
MRRAEDGNHAGPGTATSGSDGTGVLDAAYSYRARGFTVTPALGKRPILEDWPNRRLTEGELREHFKSGVNVGVLNGEPSRGLVDVDLDAPEALAVADAFLPSTGLVFGRASKLRSHRVYVADPLPITAQFKDIEDDGTMLVELRSTGTQTVWPPSVHPAGELITFQTEHEPARITAPELRVAVARVAACALLARHWPRMNGSRHDIALAAAGFLLRGGLEEAVVGQIIAAAARVAGDEEVRDRLAAVLTTARALAGGKPATGGATLAQLLGQAVVRKLAAWLFEEPADSSAAYKDGRAAEQTLRFRTAAEIARETPAEVRWAAKPWWAFGATTELAGKIKASGKTTLATHMVRCVLDGEPFLGEPTTKSPVVLLTEQPPASFRETLRRADLLGREDLFVLYAHEALGLPWPQVAAAAIAEAERQGARAIVVDTLGRFAGLRGDGENNAGDAEAAVLALAAQATARGMAVLLIRHERKSGGEVGDAARGSSAFGGAVDIVLLLRRMEHAPRKTVRVLFALSRFDDAPDELVIDLTEHGYEPLGTPANLAREEARRLLLGVLPAGPEESLAIGDRKEKRTNQQTGEVEEVEVKGLCSLTGLKKTLADEVLGLLDEKGVISHVGEGKRGDPRRYYRVRAQGEDPSAANKPYRAAEQCGDPGDRALDGDRNTGDSARPTPDIGDGEVEEWSE